QERGEQVAGFDARASRLEDPDVVVAEARHRDRAHQDWPPTAERPPRAHASGAEERSNPTAERGDFDLLRTHQRTARLNAARMCALRPLSVAAMRYFRRASAVASPLLVRRTLPLLL